MTRPQLTALLLLCLLASSEWIAAQTLPAQLSPTAAQGFHYLLIGLAAALFCRSPRPRLLPIAAAGLALYAAPLLLLHAARTLAPAALTVVVFSLLPIVIAIATGAMKWLLPTLLGTAGILLLLPVSLPQTPRGLLGLTLLLAAMLLTATAILRLRLLLSASRSLAWPIATVCLANGLALTLLGHGDPAWSLPTAAYESLRAAVIDAPQVLLLLWLLRALDPRRLSARWLIAPLFTVLSGFLLMRPPVDARLLAGIALLATGGAWLLLAPDQPETPPGSLNLRT